MASEPIATAAVAAVAVATSGPLSTVFNELGLTMALMGALGGMTFVLALEAKWRDAAKPIILGALLGFGVGIFGPAILKQSTGLDVGPQEGGVEGFAAAAYLLGIAQERVLHIFIKKKEDEENA